MAELPPGTELPTVEIDDGTGKPVRINESEYDDTKHTLFGATAPAAKATKAPKLVP